VAAVGGSRLLVGGQSTDAASWGKQNAWFVADVSANTWDPVGSPPVAGVAQQSGLASLGKQAVFVALVCPSSAQLVEPGEPGTTCTGGYDGLGIWRFDPATKAWSDVGFYDPAQLGVDNNDVFAANLVGTANNNVYVEIEQWPTDNLLINIDVQSGQLTAVTTIPDGTLLECVTASGVVVGVADDPVPVDEIEDFEGPTLAGTAAQLSTLIPGTDDFAIRTDIPLTGRLIGCGADSVALVGPVDPSPAVAMTMRWREVHAQTGALVRDTMLPSAASEESAGDTVSPLFIGEGSQELGVVLGFTSSEGDSRVVVLTTPESQPAETHLGAAEALPSALAAARLAGGQVCVLFNTTAVSLGQFGMLIAQAQ
jgi:hypothetical protein